MKNFCVSRALNCLLRFLVKKERGGRAALHYYASWDTSVQLSRGPIATYRKSNDIPNEILGG